MPSKWRSPAVKFLDRIQPVIDAGEYADPNAMREVYGTCYRYLWGRARKIARLKAQVQPWGEPAVEMQIAIANTPLSNFIEILAKDDNPYIRCAAQAVVDPHVLIDCEQGTQEKEFIAHALCFQVATQPINADEGLTAKMALKFCESHVMYLVQQKLLVACPPAGGVN